MTDKSFEENLGSIPGARSEYIPPHEPPAPDADDDPPRYTPGDDTTADDGAANTGASGRDKPHPDAEGKKAKSARKPKANTAALNGFDLTEDGIALAFAKAHVDRLRYDHSVGKWFKWGGSHWGQDDTKIAFSWARHTCRQKAKDAGAEDKLLATLAKAATASAVERFAQSDQAIAVTAEIWDKDPFLLGTPTGTVDLRTGIFRAARQEDHITKTTAVSPSATPDCPLWLDFLGQATNHDIDMIRFLKQWFGYCISGDTREEALLFAFGPGGNGKSVCLNTITGIMGSYATVAAMDTFVASAQSHHPTDLAKLRGARLVSVSETEDKQSWAESRINQLTGRDKISARFMRQDFFEYVPQFKLTIVGNHKPSLRNVNDAAKRRFNMAPFTHKPTIVDKRLAEKLRAEWPSILRWMIDGCLDWRANGLMRPEVVLDATASYFEDQDLVSQWVEQCCDRGKAHSDTVGALFGSWKAYAEANGERPESAKWFSQTLKNLGCEPVKSTPGQCGHRGFLGIGLKPIGCPD